MFEVLQDNILKIIGIENRVKKLTLFCGIQINIHSSNKLWVQGHSEISIL